MDWNGSHSPVMEFTSYPREYIQPRIDPMEALCLGLPRTGTMSVCIALNKLGIRTYDMTECARNNENGSTKRWLEAVEANYFNGRGRKIWSRRDLEDLLFRYQGVSSMPAVLFSDEMINGYSNAKVILTEIDPDKWIQSMEKSFYGIINHRSWSLLMRVDRDYSQYFIPLLRYALRIWTKNDEQNREALKQGYLAHNKHIKETVPADRLLIFKPKDGWEPLCKFLDKPIPKEAFPLIDEDAIVAGLHRNVFIRMRMTAALMGFLRYAVPILVVLFLIAYWAGFVNLKR